MISTIKRGTESDPKFTDEESLFEEGAKEDARPDSHKTLHEAGQLFVTSTIEHLQGFPSWLAQEQVFLVCIQFTESIGKLPLTSVHSSISK
jgi:hypothetical protein